MRLRQQCKYNNDGRQYNAYDAQTYNILEDIG